MHTPAPLVVMDYAGPALGAALFVVMMFVWLRDLRHGDRDLVPGRRAGD
jgi:hypothetical protein